MLVFLSIIGVILIVGLLFINLSPEFGGSHSKEDKKRYEASGHYEKGRFKNLVETKMMDMSASEMFSVMKEFLKKGENRTPENELPVVKRDSLEIVENQENRVIWFGHSAFLLQLDGKNILLDPMLGKCPAPHPTLGTNRFTEELPIEIQKLPKIDAIVISHDHYDHLDYGSIKQLKDRTDQFFVPLGVGAHLRSWHIDSNAIHELNWWEEIHLDSILLAFTPSRHFSGRGVMDNSATLWGSWVIKGSTQNIYFSGDGGYADHFKEIGEKYGPFDFAMMECGQYNEKWSTIHMMPEETAQAAVDIKTKVMMPIHWGSFKLALHEWNEPVKRVRKMAQELDIPLTVPKIGQTLSLDRIQILLEEWWLES